MVKGELPIDSLLKCNKIKKFNCTEHDIQDCVTNSKEIALSADKKHIHRIDGKLPELQVQVKKIKKNSGQQIKLVKTLSENSVKKDIEPGNDEDLSNVDPAIFNLKTECDEVTCGWKDISAVIEKKIKVTPFYIRFNKADKQGNFALNINTVSKEILDQAKNMEIEVNGEKFVVTRLEDERLKEFWDLHGYHYNTCLERRKGGGQFTGRIDIKKKNKRQQKMDSKKHGGDDRHSKQYKGSIHFKGKEYSDMNKLKQTFKNILNRTENGHQVTEPGHSMLVELLKHHSNAQKSADVKGFTVDVHPEFKDSRCFFITKNDGTKEDFSLKKCLDNIEADATKSKKQK